MIFSVDTDLTKIRATILTYLPTGSTSWDDYHREAGVRVASDIENVWYRQALQARYESVSDPNFISTQLKYLLEIYPFDSTLLGAGWHYRSTETTAVNSGERVRVATGHDSGGTVGNIYQSSIDRTSSDLEDMDFTGVGWTDVTSSLSSIVDDAACYKTLFLIYRFIANDQSDIDAFEKQRDYFSKEYEKELKSIFQVGIPYDWDESGTVDEDEKDSVSIRGKQLQVVW